MTVTAYSQTQGNTNIPLGANVQTAVVQLRLPTTGLFVIWGKVTINGMTAGTAFNIQVNMTTLDGATILDNSTLTSVDSSMSVVLHSTLDLSQPSTNEIVDIRCLSALNAFANYASLIAIPVDALSGPVAPG